LFFSSEQAASVSRTIPRSDNLVKNFIERFYG